METYRKLIESIVMKKTKRLTKLHREVPGDIV